MSHARQSATDPASKIDSPPVAVGHDDAEGAITQGCAQPSADALFFSFPFFSDFSPYRDREHRNHPGIDITLSYVDIKKSKIKIVEYSKLIQ